MEEVEVVKFGDFGHASGEGEVVRGEFEERIICNRDLVIMDAGFAACEAEGRQVGNEVDVVAAVGELDAELSSDDSAAAVSGIARDANFHDARSP
jgi:hypothetical protein